MKGQTGLRIYLNKVRRDPQGYPKVRQWLWIQRLRKCLADEQLHDSRLAEESQHKTGTDDATELEDIKGKKGAFAT